MRQLTESIRLIPMKSLQYCYRHHRQGLHMIKQERAMYGAQLDITVEHIRKRGLNTKRIEAFAIEHQEPHEKSINVTDATKVTQSDVHNEVQGAPAPSIPHSAVIPHLRTEIPQDEVSADPSRVSQQAASGQPVSNGFAVKVSASPTQHRQCQGWVDVSRRRCRSALTRQLK